MKRLLIVWPITDEAEVQVVKTFGGADPEVRERVKIAYFETEGHSYQSIDAEVLEVIRAKDGSGSLIKVRLGSSSLVQELVNFVAFWRKDYFRIFFRLKS